MTMGIRWSKKCLVASTVFLFVCSTLTVTCEEIFSADVLCRFRAEMEPTEMQVLVDGKALWNGMI